jgi:apolipoprotein N-acyltransferase
MKTDLAKAKPGRVTLRFVPATGLALLSGFLYFVAFPGVDIWPLGFVALVPLIVALRGQTPRRGMWLGWVSGFTMTMTGFYWLLEMLRVFSGFSTPLCVLFVAALCAYQAGRMALAGWLSSRAEQRGWPFGLSFTLAFGASEFIFPLLFPWYFGATVHSQPWLMQLAEIGGPILVGLPLISFNLSLSEFIEARLQRRAPRWKLAGALATAAVLSGIYGLIRIPMINRVVARAPKARAGLAQANMSLFGKRHNLVEGLQRHLNLTRQLIQKDNIDFAVWSETSVMRAVEETSANEAVPRAFSRLLGVPALVGAVLVRPVDDEREYIFFNSALSTDKSGSVTGRYDKTFLLAFGEYLPLGDTFPVLYAWSPNSGHFSQGVLLDPLKIGTHDVSTNICYEDLSPGFVNKMFRHHDAELIVNMTNDAWFGNTLEPWQHLALAKFRAIEQRRFLIRSTNSGISAFVDPTGKMLSHTGPFVEAALAHPIAWLKGRTVYRVIGDFPWWLVTGLSFAGAFFRKTPKGQ